METRWTTGWRSLRGVVLVSIAWALVSLGCVARPTVAENRRSQSFPEPTSPPPPTSPAPLPAPAKAPSPPVAMDQGQSPPAQVAPSLPSPATALIDLVRGGGIPEAACTPAPPPTTTAPGPLTSAGISAKSGWVYLTQGDVKIGVDLSRGAALGYLAVGDSGNVLDAYDTGRYLQQSFYGDDRGGKWNGKPWPFNPVQGGSWSGAPSEVQAFCAQGATLYAKTIPQDWGGTGLSHSTMEQWLTIVGRGVRLRLRFVNGDGPSTRNRDQELPAVFTRRDLSQLLFYRGDAPWRQVDPLSRVTPQQQAAGKPATAVTFDEDWLALVDQNDFGLGLYKAGQKRAISYVFLAPGEKSAVSYVAFVTPMALPAGTVADYVVEAAVADAATLRSGFRLIRAEPWLFEPLLYAARYPDLRAQVGLTDAALRGHWRQVGSQKGLLASAVFDPAVYVARNPDLALPSPAAPAALLDHYLRSGLAAGRVASAVFDPGYYRASLPELKDLSAEDLVRHFIAKGLPAGLRAHPDFDVRAYLAARPDVTQALGNDPRLATFHYLLSRP